MTIVVTNACRFPCGRTIRRSCQSRSIGRNRRVCKLISDYAVFVTSTNVVKILAEKNPLNVGRKHAEEEVRETRLFKP